MIAADVATLLPDDFLVKVDRASMANGLEVRPPLLDHELLELAVRIPASSSSSWSSSGCPLTSCGGPSRASRCRSTPGCAARYGPSSRTPSSLLGHALPP